MDSIIIYLMLLAAVFTAIIISLLAIPTIIKVDNLKKLVDEPDDERKFHRNVIPTLGGIAIFASFLISFSIWGNANSLDSYPFFVAAIFMLFLVGVKDDILVISPSKKITIQILAAIEMIVMGNIAITNLGGLFGIYQIPWAIGAIISISVFVVMINAFNLIDGIDGLAGGIGVIISSSLGGWFLLAGFNTLAILAFVLAGSLVGFLVFNFHPAKIFMGDTGAMVIGFILMYIVNQFVLLNYANPMAEYHVENASIIAIALLIVPIVDTARVFVLRVLAGKSPFEADYNHIHHQLLKEGLTPNVASPALWLGNLLVVILAYSLNYLNANVLLVIILLAGFSITPFIRYAHNILLKYIPNNYTKLISKSN